MAERANIKINLITAALLLVIFSAPTLAGCPSADLTGNCCVNYEDFAIIYDWWLQDCNSVNNFCDGADFDLSSHVDANDLVFLSSYWLETIGYIGYWSMDDDADNTTVSDSSGEENHGTARKNTSILHTTGIIDGALDFDGAGDYIQIPDSEPLSPTQQMTVCGWFWFNDASENVGLGACRRT